MEKRNRALKTLEKLKKKQNIAFLKTVEGTVQPLCWNSRGRRYNPYHCGVPTYQMSIYTHKFGRIQVGYYCAVCSKMMNKNGEEPNKK